MGFKFKKLKPKPGLTASVRRKHLPWPKYYTSTKDFIFISNVNHTNKVNKTEICIKYC